MLMVVMLVMCSNVNNFIELRVNEKIDIDSIIDTFSNVWYESNNIIEVAFYLREDIDSKIEFYDYIGVEDVFFYENSYLTPKGFGDYNVIGIERV